MKKTTAQYEEELHEMGESIARLAKSDSTQRRAAKSNYEAKRRLENAVRRHANQLCDCPTAQACLNNMLRLVPKEPRPKYGARKRVKVAS